MASNTSIIRVSRRRGGYLAGALPKLDVATINKLLSTFHGLGIVSTFEFVRAGIVAI
jgi:hypothetical protein